MTKHTSRITACYLKLGDGRGPQTVGRDQRGQLHLGAVVAERVSEDCGALWSVVLGLEQLGRCVFKHTGQIRIAHDQLSAECQSIMFQPGSIAIDTYRAVHIFRSASHLVLSAE